MASGSPSASDFGDIGACAPSIQAFPSAHLQRNLGFRTAISNLLGKGYMTAFYILCIAPANIHVMYRPSNFKVRDFLAVEHPRLRENYNRDNNEEDEVDETDEESDSTESDRPSHRGEQQDEDDHSSHRDEENEPTPIPQRMSHNPIDELPLTREIEVLGEAGLRLKSISYLFHRRLTPRDDLSL